MRRFVVRQMEACDVGSLSRGFAPLAKPQEQFEMFWTEHQTGLRVTFVAVVDEVPIGFTNLVWRSDYFAFASCATPEINNMHVLDEFHRIGIGSALVEAAELECLAAGHNLIGIGVGPTQNYAPARLMYQKLGYQADGRGPQETAWGDVVYLTKSLRVR